MNMNPAERFLREWLKTVFFGSLGFCNLSSQGLPKGIGGNGRAHRVKGRGSVADVM